jgi:hypothetical protein
MDPLKRQVRIARRRLGLQLFLRALAWCWFGTLLAASIVIGLDKFYPLSIASSAWGVAALATGVLLALAWTWSHRRSELEAALEIDRRFGLKERVSSSLSLAEPELATPAGQAVVQDAVRRLERLDVAGQFRVRLGRWAWLPVLPALLGFGLATFLKPAVDENQAIATTSTTAQQMQIKKSGEVLRKKLEDRRQEAREKGLKDAEELFGKLEQGTRELGKPEQPERKQALVKLNDLAKDLEKRRQELGSNQRLKEQLQQQLKQFQQGPADKLADALRQGNFARAAQELEKLRQDLAKGDMNAEQREQLAKQLDQLQQKLAQMADAQRQMAKELNKQIAEKQAAGDQAGAQRLQQQLDKLGQQMNDQSLQQMAQLLGKSAQALRQGDGQQAAAQLESLEAEMGKMADQQAESEMLREALDEIAAAKDGMNCKECDGAGCKACRGGEAQNGRNALKKGGNGVGHGRGDGLQPEEKTDTSLYDTRVRQKVGRGGAVMTGLAPGPNTKGRVGEEIKNQWQELRGDAADPLADQQLPRGYRDHAKTYFDALREGQKQ